MSGHGGESIVSAFHLFISDSALAGLSVQVIGDRKYPEFVLNSPCNYSLFLQNSVPAPNTEKTASKYTYKSGG